MLLFKYLDPLIKNPTPLLPFLRKTWIRERRRRKNFIFFEIIIFDLKRQIIFFPIFNWKTKITLFSRIEIKNKQNSIFPDFKFDFNLKYIKTLFCLFQFKIGKKVIIPHFPFFPTFPNNPREKFQLISP